MTAWPSPQLTIHRQSRFSPLSKEAGFTLYMVTIIEIYSVKPDLSGGSQPTGFRSAGARSTWGGNSR